MIGDGRQKRRGRTKASKRTSRIRGLDMAGWSGLEGRGAPVCEEAAGRCKREARGLEGTRTVGGGTRRMDKITEGQGRGQRERRREKEASSRSSRLPRQPPPFLLASPPAHSSRTVHTATPTHPAAHTPLITTSDTHNYGWDARSVSLSSCLSSLTQVLACLPVNRKRRQGRQGGER